MRKHIVVLIASVLLAIVLYAWLAGSFDQPHEANVNRKEIPAEEQVKRECELLQAAEDVNFDDTYRLILRGVDVNSNRCSSDICPTPLFAAVLGGSQRLSKEYDFAKNDARYEVVKALIEADADVNVVNVHNETVLMYAYADGDRRIIDMLLKTGADLTVKASNGRTASDWGKADKEAKGALLELRNLSCLKSVIKYDKEQRKKSLEKEAQIERQTNQ